MFFDFLIYQKFKGGTLMKCLISNFKYSFHPYSILTGETMVGYYVLRSSTTVCMLMKVLVVASLSLDQLSNTKGPLCLGWVRSDSIT